MTLANNMYLCVVNLLKYYFINLFKKYLYLDHANIYLEPCYDLFNLRFLTLHHENKFWV